MLQTVKSVASFDNVAMFDDEPHQIRMFKTNILFASLAVHIYMCCYCVQFNKSINMLKYKIVLYSANHVYCRRPGPGHLLNQRYREPTHDSKQETDYSLKCKYIYNKNVNIRHGSDLISVGS